MLRNQSLNSLLSARITLKDERIFCRFFFIKVEVELSTSCKS